MQQHVLQDQGQVRLTEEEANLFVALHAEQEKVQGVTTLGDLAETLRVSPGEAERLLGQVRAKLNPIPQTHPVEKQSRRKRRIWPLFLAFPVLVGLLLAGIFVWSDGFRSGQVAAGNRGPAWQGPEGEWMSTTGPFPGLMTRSMSGGAANMTVAVRTGDHVTQMTPSSLNSRENDLSNPVLRSRLEDTIFEALDFAARSSSDAKDFVPVAVSNSEGAPYQVDDAQSGWAVFDVAIDGHLSDAMSTTEGRDAVRQHIRQILAKHWPLPHAGQGEILHLPSGH